MVKAPHHPHTTAEDFKRMVHTWSAKIGVSPSGVYLQHMTQKWASCSSKGRLCFASDLLGEPKDFQELVVVHEVLHLQIPNHGKLFKSMLGAYIPDWQKIHTAAEERQRRSF